MMAKPAMNQGINNISFQQTSINHHQRKSRQGRTAGPNQITTSSITSYWWELRTEAELPVWPDWPWSTLRAAVAPATNMTTSSKARASATVVTAEPTKGIRKNGIWKTSFKKSKNVVANPLSKCRYRRKHQGPWISPPYRYRPWLVITKNFFDKRTDCTFKQNHIIHFLSQNP